MAPNITDNVNVADPVRVLSANANAHIDVKLSAGAGTDNPAPGRALAARQTPARFGGPAKRAAASVAAQPAAGAALASAASLASPAARTRRINQLLRKVFGMKALRGGQRRVIDSVLDGRDTLAVMPTGSGKSLCYQVPAALLDGATIVVSPLISLMKDQLDKLEDIGMDNAAQVNSSLSRAEEQAVLEGIGSASKNLIFCTPERLVSPEFLALLKQHPVALVVIDEAHCISQWGHDFRPAYLEIGAALVALGRPQLLALTATATQDVIDDIATQLGRPRIAVINTGIYRPNLHYRVRQVTNPDEKYATALQLVRESGGVGIVYAATVKAAEELHQLLHDAGESVTLYHGKLGAAERIANQNLFMSGERRVMVATNAFGMGIDKSDTRFVIHLQVPANLEAYYQESGRAGRDGLDAECTLLYYHADKRLQQFFLGKHYPSANELKTVHALAQQLTQQQASFTLDDLKPLLEQVPDQQLKICLKMLKDGKLLKRNRKLAYVAVSGTPEAAQFDQMAQVYVDKQERDRDSLEQMVGYAQSGYCRWKLLLDYFGDASLEAGRCCRCDNCLAPPALMVSPEDAHGVTEAGDPGHVQLAPQYEIPCDDEFPAHSAATAAPAEPAIVVGSKVKVPKFDIGTVLSVAGDKVTIAFPENTTKIFMAEFVEPV